MPARSAFLVAGLNSAMLETWIGRSLSTIPPARRGVLDAHLDHVADRGVAALGAAEHLDADDRPRARVVGDVQDRLHLNHCLALQSNLRRTRRSFGPRRDGKRRGF